MRHLLRAGLLGPGALLLASAGRPALTITTAELETRLLKAIDGVQTLRYSVAAQERVRGRYQPMQSAVKMTSSPLRMYLKNQKGLEILYVTGQNGGDAWVYPGAFPYVTLSLDPQGSLMRRDQHHTVLQIGFGLISTLLRDSEPAFTHSFRYAGDTVVAGRSCYQLRSVFPAFAYVSYQAKAGETTTAAAARLHCGEYRILERNKLEAGTQLTAGQVLKVPNAYGSRTLVLVDQRTFLPAAVVVHDERGLYEKYEFTSVVTNQPIAPAEFSKQYPGYKL